MFNLNKNLILFWIISVICLIFPIIILIFKDFFKYKFYILIFGFILIILLLKFNKIKNKELGITLNNFFVSLKDNFILILIFSFVVIIIRLLGFKFYIPTETLYFYLFYIFILSFIQEFIYRGVYFYFENKIYNKYIIMLLSTFLYSFVHIIYGSLLTCFITFIMGMIWYNIYRKNKNIFGVWFSHAFLGFLSIFLGIID